MNAELVAAESASQVRLQFQQRDRVRVHVFVEQFKAPPPLILRSVHGRVCITQEIFGPFVRREAVGYAYADGSVYLMPAQAERLREFFINSLGCLRSIAHMPEVIEDDGELGASHPCDHVAPSEGG